MKTDEDIKKVIAFNIKMLREDRKLSQVELGRIFGKAKTTVSTWERAESMPDAVTLYNLAVFFDKSLYYMYGESASGVADLRGDERELLELYNALNDRGQEHVRMTARSAALLPEFKKDTIGVKEKMG